MEKETNFHQKPEKSSFSEKEKKRLIDLKAKQLLNLELTPDEQLELAALSDKEEEFLKSAGE